MNSDQKILVDCDGVLSDFVGGALQLARDLHGIERTHADWTEWTPTEDFGWPTWKEDVDNAILHRNFVLGLKPLRHAVEFLHLLEDLVGRENVLVCTAPWGGRAGSRWLAQRHDWLRIHMQVPTERQIHCDRKDLVEGWLIDDSPKHLRARRYKVGAPGFMIDQPWNRGADVGSAHGSHADCLRYVFGCHYKPQLAGFFRNLEL